MGALDDRALVNRLLPITAIGTVVLWFVGAITIGEEPDWEEAPSKMVEFFDDTAPILWGSLLFLAGCLVFLWFLNLVRGRLGEAEGAGGRLSSLAFAAGSGTAIVLMLTRAATLGLAIAVDDSDAPLAPATAQFALLGSTGFFVVAELLAGALLLTVAVIAFRTGALPRWLAWASVVVAVILWIPPIGWLAMIFGLPLWVIVTGLVLSRSGAPAPAVPA